MPLGMHISTCAVYFLDHFLAILAVCFLCYLACLLWLLVFMSKYRCVVVTNGIPAYQANKLSCCSKDTSKQSYQIYFPFFVCVSVCGKMTRLVIKVPKTAVVVILESMQEFSKQFFYLHTILCTDAGNTDKLM